MRECVSEIEGLGDRYSRKYLTAWDKQRLEEDRWEAVKLFYHHSFMRGRRDQRSYEYFYFTIATLEGYLAIGDENHAEVYEAIQTRELNRQLDPRWVLDFKKEQGLTQANSLTHPLFHKEVVLKTN